jgi:hypothetical protein
MSSPVTLMTQVKTKIAPNSTLDLSLGHAI